MRYFAAFIFALIIAFPVIAEEEALPPPNAPPAWFMENIAHMTSHGGRWIADNSDYKSETETWDAYGMEWVSGPGGYSMSGRLFAIKDGVDTEENFWIFSQYWDPTTNSGIVQQYGWISIGTGTMTSIGDEGEIWMAQDFPAFDGSSTTAGHRATTPDENTHDTWSYDIDNTGHWSESRFYRWTREPPAE